MDPEIYDSILQDWENEGDSAVERTPSVRLKSALKTLPDYLKNKTAKRRYEAVTEVVRPKALDDSTIVLGKIWDKAKSEHVGKFYHFVESTFPSYDRGLVEIFRAEIQILCGNTQGSNCDVTLNSVIYGELKNIAPNLLPLYLFFSFLVTISWGTYTNTTRYAWPVIKESIGILWAEYDEKFKVGIYDMWALLQAKYHAPIIIHRDHLLNITDKLGERLNCFIFSSISNQVQDMLSVSMNCLDRVMAWGDTVIKNHGSAGFQLLSNYEPLVVGVLLSRGDDRLWDTTRFLTNVISDIKEELSWAVFYVDELLELLSGLSIDQLCDIHGLYRIWGHPEVQLKQGLEKMFKISMADKVIDQENINISGRMFKELFFRNYKKIHKHYPNFTFNVIDESELNELLLTDYVMKCLNDNQEIRIDEARYELNSWDRVSILKNFEIPYSWNLAHNIKDKAVSPDREELKTSVRRGLGAIWQDARRTVLKWLNLNILSMRDFLSNIDRFGMDVKHLIIGLYAKERELKYYPRFFSLMSFYLRLYVVSTEQLISDNLLQYFPQITMTSDLLSMTKKILKLSGKMKEKDDDFNTNETRKKEVSYSINIDFKKWNQQMRYEITEPVFTQIDATFGFTNVIRRTHQFFQGCYVYLCSGEYTPEISGDSFILEPPWSWTNDGSGKEGLRQKGWTIMTVCMIEYVMRQHAARSQLIGGGDNQVLVVTLETESLNNDGTITNEGKRELKERMEKILKDLDSFFTSVGLPLKINETWVSSELFMYNKIMCYRGRTLRSCLKTASRSFPFSDDAATTLHGIMSTLGTSVKSLCSKDFSHLPAYVFSRWLVLIASYLVFYFHPLIPGGINNLPSIQSRYGNMGSFVKMQVQRSNMTIKKLITRCLFYFRIFGGYGIGVPSDWVMRGFPDPLTSAIAWINRCLSLISGTNPYRDELTSFISMSTKPGDPSYLHLISDPVSINHDGPIHGLARLREEAEKAIVESPLVKNHNLKEIAKVCYSQNSQSLLNAMCSSNVLEPKFLHDIFSATLYGYFNSIVSRVDKSATITRLNKKANVMEALRITEIEYILYSLERSSHHYDMKPATCSRITAEIYRSTSWKKPIVGVTVPSPVEVFSTIRESWHTECDENYVLLNVMEKPNKERPYGPLEPYLGSFTDEKFKLSPLANAFGEESLLNKAIHIQKLRYWRYNKGTDLFNLIETILKSECDLDPDSVFILHSSSSSATHRYSGEVLAHGAIMNANPDAYRYFAMTTSTLQKRSKGGRNDMIHFQGSLLWISSMMVNKATIAEIESGTYHFHEECDTCIYPLYEVLDEDTTLNTVPNVPIMKDNTLAYVPSNMIQISYADEVLIKKYRSLRCQIADPQVAVKEELIYDAISQVLFVLLTGKRVLTGSQVNKLFSKIKPDMVFGKLKTLLNLHEEFLKNRGTIKWGKLDPILSNVNIIDMIKRLGLSVPRKHLHKKGISCSLLVPQIMMKVNPEDLGYLTTLDIDPWIIIAARCYLKDPALRTCEECKKSLLSLFVSNLEFCDLEYSCEFHTARKIPQLVFVPTDAYSISKEGTYSLSNGGNEKTTTRVTANALKVIPRVKVPIPITLPPYSCMREIISGSDICSLAYMMLWLMSKSEANSQILILTEADWNILFMLIHIAKVTRIEIRIVTKLSQNSTTGSEFSNLVGFRDGLREEDKRFIIIDEPQEHTLRDGNCIQVVTYQTGQVYDTKYIAFPSTSILCFGKVQGMILTRRELYYPSVQIDRSNWSIAERSTNEGCDITVLHNMRHHFMKIKKVNLQKALIEEMLDSSIYPIRSHNAMARGLPEIEQYKLPVSRLQLIYNVQVLMKHLDNMPMKWRRTVEGVWKYHCHAFIIMLALSLPPFKSGRLLKGLQEYRYDQLTKTLILKRRNVSNALLCDTFQYFLEDCGRFRVPIKITGYNKIFLVEVDESLKGIHVI
ncbi:L [Maize fine streak virus]|uniref:Replicase n=1 Tax=Maize fine streak virus TaxID=209854 RepID=Q6E0X2_9RHAB|nr:L [Maize fine streak nucleorhabdovirus] [Maize fine streak virus]AAT66751.1 L [Maize fine streak nucleorhabdovirus] [Maize fine streak virus]